MVLIKGSSCLKISSSQDKLATEHKGNRNWFKVQGAMITSLKEYKEFGTIMHAMLKNLMLSFFFSFPQRCEIKEGLSSKKSASIANLMK